MKLFKTNLELKSVKVNPLILSSPLGNIDFGIKVNGEPIKPSLSEVFSASSNAFLSNWMNGHFYISFLRSKFNPSVPSGMDVDECFAGIWRVRVLQTLSIDFSCLLNTHLSGYAEPGEYLIAQSFENEKVKLSMGTEDEDQLINRAELERWLPLRLKKEITYSNIECQDNGLNVNLPILYQSEQVQVHFIVAWSSKNNREISTWYAVEQSTNKILQQIGFCSN